ncbi:MAG: tetratricopeptide repeat protein, partial [Planctomycetes bacterium]|nr:tetratricopeptide repeat protein [Planctomycetota bacterium]
MIVGRRIGETPRFDALRAAGVAALCAAFVGGLGTSVWPQGTTKREEKRVTRQAGKVAASKQAPQKPVEQPATKAETSPPTIARQLATAARAYANAQQYEQSGRYKEALAAYRSVVDNYPNTWCARDALLKMAGVYRTRYRIYDKAVAANREFLTKFADDDRCAAVQLELAEIYSQNLHNPQQAIAEYESFLAQHPDGERSQ